jgi:lipopolysaccharide/colanic/teichoic acid biosynthesis glycosyltransferase
MNLIDYPSERTLATRSLLFAGFEGDFSANIRNFPYESGVYNFEILNESRIALSWLKRRTPSFDAFLPPYAVLCNLQWLEATGFQLIRAIRAHADLKHIPVIALTAAGQPVDKATLLAEGIDDCYAIPVEWDVLEQRLDFLNQFKPVLLNESEKGSVPVHYRYKTPLVKRLFDILAASIGIILTFPVWLSVAIAIRLESRGAVIYRSKRAGAGYQVFDFFKFRSMYVDADRRLEELLHLNQYSDCDNYVFIKLVGDPRVTRVGKFIRRYSLDELPQLINILLGDMSLVGNRPLPLYEAESLVQNNCCERFLAPAGLTGLWQVSKKRHPDMSVQERVQLDIQYSKEHSIWYDFNIIARTFSAMVQHEEV